MYIYSIMKEELVIREIRIDEVVPFFKMKDHTALCLNHQFRLHSR